MPASFSRRDAILLGGLGLVACLVAADIILRWRGNADFQASKPLLKPVKPVVEDANNVAVPKPDPAPARAKSANNEPAPTTKHKRYYDRVTQEGPDEEYMPGNETPASKSSEQSKPAAVAKPQKKQITDRVPQ